MTTEVKPRPTSPSSVRWFRRKVGAEDGTDLLVMAPDGNFYFNKIHHNNLVEGWEMLDMMLMIKKDNWEEK